MFRNEEDLNIAEEVVKMALAKGADEAEVFINQRQDFNVTVRKGAVEKISEAAPHSLNLRVYNKKRGAVRYSSDFSREGLEKLVADAVELTTLADSDPAAGLPDPEGWAKALQEDLQTWDAAVGDIPPEVKINMIRRAEDASFAADPRITNANGTTFGSVISSVSLVNSLGFSGSYRNSGCYMYASPIAEDKDGKKQVGGWFSYSHHFNQLARPEDVGKKAAEMALRQLGARKVKTRSVPVIWENTVAGDFWSIVFGAVSGEAVYRRQSFLLDSEGQQVGSKLVNVVDDPLTPNLPGSRPFDGEGVTSRRNPIFTEGVFNSFLFNTYSSRKTGRATTGSASANIGGLPGVAPTNLYLQPGTSSLDELIASVDDGLYLTDTIGFNENLTTGDFSRGAVGWWIENGKLAYPVAEINIAANLKDMLGNITMVGNDLDWTVSFGIASPSVRMENIMVSGL